MEQEKIGNFIKECRKEKKLTQNELAEKLNITNKAVSKWETGRGMPDSSILLELSNILDVTVNELLSGEKLEVNEYKVKAEENIITIAKENDKSKKNNKKIIIVFSCILTIIGVAVLILSRYMGGFLFAADEKITFDDLKLNIVLGNEKLTHIRFISDENEDSDSAIKRAEIMYTFKDDKCVSERFKNVFVDENSAKEQYDKWNEMDMINLEQNGNEVSFNADSHIGKSKEEILSSHSMEYEMY